MKEDDPLHLPGGGDPARPDAEQIMAAAPGSTFQTTAQETLTSWRPASPAQPQ
jgi:hypothetical protein